MIRVGLIEKVTLEQRFDNHELAMQISRGRAFHTNATAKAEAGLSHSRNNKKASMAATE